MEREHSTVTIGEAPPAARGPAALFAVLTAEEPLSLAASTRHLLADVAEVEVRRGDGRAVHRSGGRLVVSLPDKRLSAPHARLGLEGGFWHVADLGSKNGVLVNGARADRAVLGDGDVLELGYSFFVFRAATPLQVTDRPDVSAAEPPARQRGLLSLNPSLEGQFAELDRVAATRLTVLIGGETGTGKELVARAVHRLSGRSGPLVSINCAALSKTLLEAELFGFKKGSFSGAAHDRAGLITASDGGSLFLDEIAELPLEGQAALLRVLQEREVMPIGATRAEPVDLRLLAATHYDLDAAVDQGRFRADLRMRLGGARIHLPPLRTRREDLGILTASLAGRLAPERDDMTLAHQTARLLFARTWPGNVRELERALELAIVGSAEGRIVMTSAPAPPPARIEEAPSEPARLRASDQQRRSELDVLMREHGGNVTVVARRLGKAREQVYRWIKRLGIDPARYRD